MLALPSLYIFSLFLPPPCFFLAVSPSLIRSTPLYSLLKQNSLEYNLLMFTNIDNVM